ncbi:MAG: tetratricopeptide repeat protein, partial [Thermomonas sp.]
MSATSPQAGVDTAIAHAMGLLAHDPAAAIEQAREVLVAVPGQPIARLVIGMAHNARKDFPQAIAELEPLAAEQPNAPAVQMALGAAL